MDGVGEVVVGVVVGVLFFFFGFLVGGIWGFLGFIRFSFLVLVLFLGFM